MTTTSTVAARLVAALGDALARRGGTQLEDLVDGYAVPVAPLDDRLQPTDRGWPAAVDLDTTPDPAFIGAATGTRVPGGLTTEQQRDYVRDRASFRRGTPAAIKGAVRGVLTGATKRVDIIERDGSPWRFSLRVWASELPGYDPAGPETGQAAEAAVVAAAATQKPVGIVIDTDVEVIEHNATYAHLSAEHGTYADLLAAFPTPALAAAHVPEEGTLF